jgi:uncharacterized protein (TIGR00288 family)
MEEERIGLFIDFENLAIGARDEGLEFAFKPIADALAERGRVVVRRAYADWSYFEDARRMLVRNHVELIEIPQRMGSVRKNAADIKMAVDAIELAFERDYVTSFVICSGDSDFTPLVQKLRELNKRVIGVGLKASTSQLLPAACDEFLFYESLEGVERPRKRKAKGPKGAGTPEPETEPDVEPEAEGSDIDQLAKSVTQTLAGLQRSAGGEVRSSSVKRALLRKDSTFTESDYGFRAFGELMRNLEKQGVITLREAGAKGDPVVDFPETGGEAEAFALLRTVVVELGRGEPLALSGLKNQLRKRQHDFSEKRFGYRGFLEFAKAAKARGIVELEWDDKADDYVLTAPGG